MADDASLVAFGMQSVCCEGHKVKLRSVVLSHDTASIQDGESSRNFLTSIENRVSTAVASPMTAQLGRPAGSGCCSLLRCNVLHYIAFACRCSDDAVMPSACWVLNHRVILVLFALAQGRVCAGDGCMVSLGPDPASQLGAMPLCQCARVLHAANSSEQRHDCLRGRCG